MFKGWFKRKYARIPIAEWTQWQEDVLAVTKIATATLNAIETLATTSTVNEVSARIELLVQRVNENRKVVDMRLGQLPSKEDFDRVRNLAENAYDCVLGTLPDSGVTARKLDGAVVTTGLPNA
jgi:hypothetical protein